MEDVLADQRRKLSCVQGLIMAIDYMRMRATAKRLLTENGTVFNGVRPGTVERVDGEEVVTQDMPLKIIGVLTEYKPFEIDGKAIMTGDTRIVATADTVIKVGDIFTIDGVNWRVEKPWPVKPAMLVICYRVQLRGV